MQPPPQVGDHARGAKEDRERRKGPHHQSCKCLCGFQIVFAIVKFRYNVLVDIVGLIRLQAQNYV